MPGPDVITIPLSNDEHTIALYRVGASWIVELDRERVGDGFAERELAELAGRRRLRTMILAEGKADDPVVFETIPDELRPELRKAGRLSTHPANGAIRMIIARDLAAEAVADDPDGYAWIIGDAQACDVGLEDLPVVGQVIR